MSATPQQTTQTHGSPTARRWSTPSTAARINVVAMAVAIVGIVVQIALGVDYPTVPPGPILLAAAVVLVIFAPWRWAPVAGVVVPLFLVVGGSLAAVGNADNPLRRTDDAAVFAASITQLVGDAVALVAGIVMLREARRRH